MTSTTTPALTRPRGDAIDPAPRDGRPAPATAQQRRYWHELPRRRAHGREAVFHSLLPLRLTGPLDPDRLARALERVVERHDAMRARFTTTDGRLEMRTLPAQAVALPVHALEGELHDAIEAFVGAPFDLERGPAWRARLLATAPSEHVLLLIVHHIVYDGWSMQVLLEELAEEHAALAAGRAAAIEPLTIQYADYARRCDADPLRRPAPPSFLDYWRAQLAGAATTPFVPTDRPRPDAQTWAGALHAGPLPALAGLGLEQVARETGASFFQAFLAVLAIELRRRSGREDLLVGSPAANRTPPEVERLIGLFTNLLPLRLRVPGGKRLDQLVAEIRDTVLEAMEHESVPFERIAETAGAQATAAHHPLVQVVATYSEGAGRVAFGADGPWAEPVAWRLASTVHFDLTFILQRRAEGFVLESYYATDLFDRATIEALAANLAALLTVAGRLGAGATVDALVAEAARQSATA